MAESDQVSRDRSSPTAATACPGPGDVAATYDVRGPVRWVAGAVARVLETDGRTADERRAQVVRDMTATPDDAHDLWARHISRSIAWFVIMAVVFVPSLPVAIAVREWRGTDGVFTAVLVVAGFLTFFAFFVAAIHLCKALVSSYFLEHRWDPRSRIWRVAMLAPTPDLVIAAALAVAVAASFT